MSRGTDVYPVGSDLQKEVLKTTVAPDKVASVARDAISVQSVYVHPGFSGGPLLDTCGRVVAMVKDTSGRDVDALPIDLVLDVLKGWSVPVSAMAVKSTTCGTVATAVADSQPNRPLNSAMDHLLKAFRESPSQGFSFAAKAITNCIVEIKESRPEEPSIPDRVTEIQFRELSPQNIVISTSEGMGVWLVTVGSTEPAIKTQGQFKDLAYFPFQFRKHAEQVALAMRALAQNCRR